jgi:hypothetical protein
VKNSNEDKNNHKLRAAKAMDIQGNKEDRRTILKDRDNQVTMPADLDREQPADNEMDGQDAIKLYNELVKSPQDRQALEKEMPALIAARDKAVTEAKRKQLQKETAQITDRIPKMRR